MNIIEFFKCNRKKHWLDKIAMCDWRAGAFLYDMIKNDRFYKNLGENSELMMLTDGDDLVSFCTYSQKDEIPDTELTPWIGFVYTFPEYRGHHYIGKLFEKIESDAEKEGISKIYISTDHEGLYEKYGYEYLTQMNDSEGYPSRIYVKKIGS